MALRDLVMGGGACAVPGTSSSANPLGGLAESIFGSASKTQVYFLLPLLHMFPSGYVMHEVVVFNLDIICHAHRIILLRVLKKKQVQDRCIIDVLLRYNARLF
jgi:hypothetical protein